MAPDSAPCGCPTDRCLGQAFRPEDCPKVTPKNGPRCETCGHPIRFIGDTPIHDIDWIEGWDFHLPKPTEERVRGNT